MTGPLTGIKVIEVANFLAVPSCAALMADMGADVIKVEPLAGDQYRWLSGGERYHYKFPINYAFELDNRGKRGIAIDLNKSEANPIMRKLVNNADVFLTNLLPDRMRRFKLSYEELSKDKPELIYLVFSGYGPEGPDKDRLGFDHTAFWASTGLMSLYSKHSNQPIDVLNGMGDHTASPMLLSGVLAAILERQRTGKGRRITANLLNTGFWVLGADVSETLASGQPLDIPTRAKTQDSLVNTYKTKDNKWFLVVMPDNNTNWARLCKAIERPDLISNPRYVGTIERVANSEEIIRFLDDTFAQKSLAQWAPQLNANQVIYAPVTDLRDALKNPQIAANDMLRTINHPIFGKYKTLNTPIHLENTDIGPKGPAPDVGQHTEEVLLEIGYSWNDITNFQDSNVILGGK